MEQDSDWFVGDLTKFKPKHRQVIVEQKQLKYADFKKVRRIVHYKETYPPQGTCLYPERVQMIVKLHCHCYAYVDAKLCGVSGLGCRGDDDVKVYTAWSLLNLLQYAMDEATCEQVKRDIGMKNARPPKARAQ
jgi:hypothetical protein